VGCGAPVVMDALLHNKEEVDLNVLYVDPVHDFAILRYDAQAVKYQRLSEVGSTWERQRSRGRAEGQGSNWG
jgi:hypothetical protein